MFVKKGWDQRCSLSWLRYSAYNTTTNYKQLRTTGDNSVLYASSLLMELFALHCTGYQGIAYNHVQCNTGLDQTVKFIYSYVVKYFPSLQEQALDAWWADNRGLTLCTSADKKQCTVIKTNTAFCDFMSLSHSSNSFPQTEVLLMWCLDPENPDLSKNRYDAIICNLCVCKVNR